MWDRRYARRILMPHMSLTSTANVLQMAASLQSGRPPVEALRDPDAGFAKLRELKPNLLSIFTNATQALGLMEQGEAWMIPGDISSYTLLRKAEGAPVDLNTPAEGSLGLPSGIALVRGGPNPEVAQALIAEMLTVPVQPLWAERYFDTPANTRVPLGPGIVPIADLIPTDWEYVSAQRSAWIERFDREIAR